MICLFPSQRLSLCSSDPQLVGKPLGQPQIKAAVVLWR